MKRQLCLALVGVICVSVVAVGQIKKGKTRPATTHQIMGGVVGPFCSGIGEGLKSAPADDKAWEALSTKAALLNEAGYFLMDDGRCPDGEWSKACEMLRNGSASLLEKLAAKDATGAQDAFKGMTQACGTCHKAHKKG